MQQEIRPLVAVDIIEQLHRQFAILSGKGKAHLRFQIFVGGAGGVLLGGPSLLNLDEHCTQVSALSLTQD